jgi:hypothetical protein
LLAKRTGTDLTALAEYCGGVVIPVDVLELEVGALAAPHPGVEQKKN